MAVVVELAVLVGTGLAACAQAEYGTSSPTPSNVPSRTPGPGQQAPGEGSSAETSLTVGTTEGPYYISGTTEIKDGNLNMTELAGDPIRVSGHVYVGGGTDKPIAGAKVEIWQADDGGSYHPNSNGEASQYSADQLALRGYVLTDETGRYEFTSIYPGYYQGRTRHIHTRVSADGFGAVTTQIIVPPRSGDQTTPETDMIAQSLPDANQVTFTKNASTGVLETTFDFHLAQD